MNKGAIFWPQSQCMYFFGTENYYSCLSEGQLLTTGKIFGNLNIYLVVKTE